jgi:carbamoyl-phosphate synthase small subunit
MSGARAWLALADGTIFEGTALGAAGTTTGEVVFTTGMTGYQEVLTDPSYCGQIVTMTAPEIGNTGIVAEDAESVHDAPWVSGFLVREASPVASSWRASETLSAWLERHGVVALAGLDTRRLTRHLRDHGSQNGAIGTSSPEELVRRAREAPSMVGLDLVARVTPKERYRFTEATGAWRATPPPRPAPATSSRSTSA